ncbi:MAG: hypothetical protein JXR83_04975 [Deltaproteobacteria bacterium]|nr:hypothetical protein [Deltaproteobacteria bacterium]
MVPYARVEIVDQVCDVEDSGRPFGKRWHQEEVRLGQQHLEALRAGKVVAIDVQEEYVVFVRLDESAQLRNMGRGE